MGDPDRKRNSDTKVAQAQRETNGKSNRASPTTSSPVTTAVTKTAEAQQETSKVETQQKAAQARRESKHQSTARAQQSISLCAA
jgi:hypothetical protein